MTAACIILLYVVAALAMPLHFSAAAWAMLLYILLYVAAACVILLYVADAWAMLLLNAVVYYCMLLLHV